MEHILIPLFLAGATGDRQSALSSYGVLSGMAIPLVLYPAVVTSSFAGLLIPEVAGSAAAGEATRIASIGRRAVFATLLFSIGAGVWGLLLPLLLSFFFYLGFLSLFGCIPREGWRAFFSLFSAKGEEKSPPRP